MAKCIECGTQMGFVATERCGTCHQAWLNLSKDVPMSVSSVETPITSKNKEVIPTIPSNEALAATAFTSIAWVIVALLLICSAFAALALAADGQGFMAIIVFVSGCFSAVFLGLLAEISANIARLVNKSH